MRIIAAGVAPVCLLAVSGALALSAGEFTLVRDSNPEAAIVLEARPTRSVQMGALELRHHMKLITGAELATLQGSVPGEKRVVRIGGVGRPRGNDEGERELGDPVSDPGELRRQNSLSHHDAHAQ